MKRAEEHQDWMANYLGFALAWGLPVGAILISAVWFQFSIPFMWPIAFAWMALGCVLNAYRCRRVHCYFTSVFFALMALLSIAHAQRWIEIPGDGWMLIGNAGLIGGVLLACATEKIFGQYFKKFR